MGGLRNSYLSREACRLRDQGSSLEQILLRLRAYNETRCDPPLPDEEIIRIAHEGRERHALNRDAEVARFAGLVGFAAANTPEPQELRAPRDGAASRYPLAALGPVLGAAARRILEVTQAPAALCGQSLLAAASLAAQAHADAGMDGRREPLSLYLVSVGELGERKSHVERIALTAHREHERAALEQHRRQMPAYQIARAAHEAARRTVCRGTDPLGIQHALEALGPAPVPPATGIFLAPAASHETLSRLYAQGQPSLGLFQNDARGLFPAQAADAARIRSAAGLARLWDAGEIDHAGAEAKYFGRRLTLHLLLPAERAQQIFGSEGLVRSGLLSRTLLSWPAAPAGEPDYVEADLTVDPALLRYHACIRALLTTAPTGGELAPRVLTLAPAARQAWIAAHNAWRAAGDEGLAACARDWAAKAPAQMLRIAGVLTLVENPAAQTIRAETIEQARVLVQHHLDETARLASRSGAPPEIRNAEALRDWCHRQGIRLLHSAEALQFGPRCVRTAAAFDVAIRLLEHKGWAARIPGDCVIDGRRRRRAWHIAAPRHEAGAPQEIRADERGWGAFPVDSAAVRTPWRTC